MWVVYEWMQYEGSWGHKYFNEESNARAYFEVLVDQTGTSVLIEEIETED